MWTLITSYFKSSKLLLYLGLLASVVLVIGLIVWKYNSITTKYFEEKAKNKALVTALDLQEDAVKKSLDTINRWQSSQVEFIKTVEEMKKTNNIANQNLRRLNEIFSQHNLNELSLKKPNLMQSRINRGTNDALILLRCNSGAKDNNCAH